MEGISRPLARLALGMSVLVAGCDPATARLTAPDVAPVPQFQIFSATGPITGIWSGVVTTASGLNNTSFGRPPSDWIGKHVIGSFAIHLSNAGIGDRNSALNVWEFGPVPGPGPFIEFVTSTALIDGQGFRTSGAKYQHVFFGDVASVNTANRSVGIQDSYVGIEGAGIGRDVISFDAFFSAGGVSFDGVNLAIDPSRLVSGAGVIEDLLDVGGAVVRRNTILFTVTNVSLSSAGTLLQQVIALTGHLQPNQVAGLVDKVNQIALKLSAGEVRAACNQLGALTNQIDGFIAGGQLLSADAQLLLNDVQTLRVALGC